LFIPVLVASLLFYFQNYSFRNIKSYSEIHSPYGTRTTFYLSDGSTGWLNGGSSLKFPTQFGGKVRDVKLTGEAYFNVIPNHKKPFVVSTDNIDVKVFGTSFNVMAYADEQITEVTLESGQVEVFKKTNNIIKSIGILKPNESCIYNFRSDSSKILSINSTEKLSWLDGKLTFKYEPFEEVVRKINRWYNVNIVIKDELLNSYIYYGTFKDETLEEVLRLLQFTAPIRYKDIERERKQDGTFEKRKIEIYYKK
jgi:ferric-dicitrate binding protein FerR (iron transport regulator)